MKNLLTKLRYVPKRFAIAAAVIVAGTTAALTFAWGPSRATYTIANPATKVTFNSIIDNPNVGDERNFVVVKDAAVTTDGGWQDTVTVQPGKEYLVRMYVHNNAASSLNLTALNTRVTAALGTNTGTKVDMTGYVSADNADPKQVWDDISFTSASTFNMVYVPGSAMIYNNATGPSGRALGNSIMNGGGALVGYASNDGKVPGCFQYASYVYIKVKPQFAATPNFEVAKTVSKHDAFQWGENVSVNPGDLVDFRIKYSNIGQTQQDNVVVKDQLPADMTYVTGTTKLYNNVYPSGQALADTITSGGVNIGNHAAGSASFVVFTAKVAANDQLDVCGANTLTNTARVETDNGYKTDTASVSVTKTCEQPQPSAACKLVTPHVISRTEFSFDGQAEVANGATVSKYTFVVKNTAGAVVKTITVNSTALSVNSGTVTLPNTGVYTVMLTVTTSLGDKTNANCQTTVEVKPAPVVPVYVCNFVTVNQISRTQFSFVTNYTVENATFVRVDYVVRNAAGAEIYRGTNNSYTQSTVGMYSVEAIVVVKVDGVEKTATSANCKKSFEVKPEDKDIQVCRLSDKTIVTIKESAFDASKYSKNLDDCKPAPNMINVCELATSKIISIKEADFDSTKYSKNLADCNPAPKMIDVCRLSDKTVVSIKESDFDSTKYSKNLEDCKPVVVPMIKVCELSTKKLVTIKEADFDANKYSKTLSDCDTPQTIANTGPEMIASGLLGSSALGLTISSFIRSRRTLLAVQMNRS